MEADLARRVAAAAAALRAGGIVVYPTETFYGLGALASDGGAVERLVRAKLRPEGKPLPLLAADRDQVAAVAVLDGPAACLADAFWPGPLTLVLPARPGLHAAIAGEGTVGIRVPGSELARALAAAAGGALVSTSANPSGGPPPVDVGGLDPALRVRVDHVLDAGRTPGGLPSTVVAVEPGGVRLVRPGAVPLEAITAALGSR